MKYILIFAMMLMGCPEFDRDKSLERERLQSKEAMTECFKTCQAVEGIPKWESTPWSARGTCECMTKVAE